MKEVKELYMFADDAPVDFDRMKATYEVYKQNEYYVVTKWDFCIETLLFISSSEKKCIEFMERYVMGGEPLEAIPRWKGYATKANLAKYREDLKEGDVK